MRTFALACLLAVSLSAHSEDSVSCRSRDPASEHAWNPPKAAVTQRLRYFYSLSNELEAAQEANDFDKVRKLAKEYLAVAEEYRCNWNYGNAVHDGNAALGLAALSEHDESLTARYLLEAAKSPGSPQLNSFGPTMVLADKLVGAGEREAVIGYLQGVRGFWRMDNGEIEKWIALLRAGERPDFRMQLK